MSATAPRKKAFLLARPEQRRAGGDRRAGCRRRVPSRPPDRAGAGRRGRRSRCPRACGWLWWPSALLVVHWLGDSLDGTLARVRRAERPRYGYYLDHLADAAVDGAGRARPRAVAAHAPRRSRCAGDRVPRAVDQHVPGDAGARALHARLRPARADRGAAGADRRCWPRVALGAHASVPRARAVADAAGPRSAAPAAAVMLRAPAPCARSGNLRVLAAREPYAGVALGPAVLFLGLREHPHEQVGERDPHDDRLLERHDSPATCWSSSGESPQRVPFVS